MKYSYSSGESDGADAYVKVEHVSKYYKVGRNIITALEDVNLEIRRGEILAVVGESGSGKTTLGKITVGLVRPSLGRVLIGGKNIFDVKDPKEVWKIAQYIHQDPYSALDPYMTVDEVLDRPLRYLLGIKDRKSRDEMKLEILHRVGLDGAYLHRRIQELSGGERQRVLIARAFIVSPRYVVADEPTTMIDFVHRKDVMDLLLSLKNEFNTSFMLITHDMSVATIADNVAVLYRGMVIEYGNFAEIKEKPLHPYTQLLFSVTPDKLASGAAKGVKQLVAYTEVLQASSSRGCPYADRCPFAQPICRVRKPNYVNVSNGHVVACHMYG